MSVPDEYHRAVLHSIRMATNRWGRRPAKTLILNAASAALDISDRPRMSTALDQLLAVGYVGERKGNYFLTMEGDQIPTELTKHQVQRMEESLSLAYRSSSVQASPEQQEVLYVLARGEHFQRLLGPASVSEILNLPDGRAQDLLDTLEEDGYVDRIDSPYGVSVYALSRSGRLVLRRGDLRIESIRFPQAQSEHARRLIRRTDSILDEDGLGPNSDR